MRARALARGRGVHGIVCGAGGRDGGGTILWPRTFDSIDLLRYPIFFLLSFIADSFASLAACFSTYGNREQRSDGLLEAMTHAGQTQRCVLASPCYLLP